MSEENNTVELPEEVVTGKSEPQGVTEIPNGVNIPMNENLVEHQGEKILGKFESQEQLVKAYQELETKLGSGNEEKQTETTDNSSNESTTEDGTIDLSQYSEEFAKDGKLSEGSYQELKEIGFSKEIVDAYIQGQAALGNQWQSKVKSMVGSDEDYKNLIDWASQGGVSNEFIKEYDQAVGSMDENKARMAVEALKNMYSSSNNEPKLLDGTSLGSGGSGDVYESWQQLTEDLNSTLYHKDPAERERVQKKLSRSRI